MGLIAQIAVPPAAEGLPEPEDVFVVWLLTQPPNSDLRIAAQREIARLGRYFGPHGGPRRLSAIFEAFCDSLEPAPRLQ